MKGNENEFETLIIPVMVVIAELLFVVLIIMIAINVLTTSLSLPVAYSNINRVESHISNDNGIVYDVLDR